MPIRTTAISPAFHPAAVSRQLAAAAMIVYLRENQNRHAPESQPAQGRDLHAALLLSRHLAEAGYTIGSSIVMAPDLREFDNESAEAIGTVEDFDFAKTDLIVQATRPCLDDSPGQTRKPIYQSNHAIERDINGSLRRLFEGLSREQVSLRPAVPVPAGEDWLRRLAFGLYRKRDDSLAEATRWSADDKQIRMAGTTFGYIAFLRDLNQIRRPFLGVFGMSRDDTFRLANCLDRFPGLIADVLASKRDRICMIRMDRADDQPMRVQHVQLAQDYQAQLVLDATI